MEFLLVSPDKLKVNLSCADMERLDIDYQSMDYSNASTRKVLVELLERGKAATGFSPKRAKLYIEIYPSEEGGCVVCYTSLRSGEHLYPIGVQLTPRPVVFSFDDVGILITAACKVFERYSHRIYKSSLYSLKEGWRLTVSPLDYADRLSISFLKEFAPVTGEGEILVSFIEEHGKELIKDNALDVLAQYFA